MKKNFLDRLTQAFTGKDNSTIDIGRVIWFETIQAYIAISIYSIHKGGTFDAVAWGAGLAALVGAGGAALGLKANVEPSEMMIKTDKITYKQGIGRALPSDDGDGGDPPPPPPPPPDAPDPDDAPDTTSATISATVVKGPVSK